MNRREYLAAAVATLGAACSDAPAGAAAVERPSTAPLVDGATGVQVVTDFADHVLARGGPEEDWGPAFEAAWAAAGAEGTDLFVPAGTYRVRPRRREGGWGPALDLVQADKYRPVRMLGPARGAQLRVEAWPAGAPADLEVVRIRSGVRGSGGGMDTAVGAEVANLSIVNASGGPMPPWRTPHDHRGVGIRLVGLYWAGVTGCFFQGLGCGVALGYDDARRGVSYVVRVQACRFQYCNQAVRVPPTANGTVVRDCVLVWMHASRTAPVAAFTCGHSTGTVLFEENHAEQCGMWVYEIGATFNARVNGGRLESVAGAVRVRGTGPEPARGTRIDGLSVDCDALRGPALWIENGVGTLVTGVIFYQSGTAHPHLRVEPRARRTTVLGLESADAPLRVSDPGGGVKRLD
ncbi:MAG TPA: hypothetical protein VGC13_32660 [Longimicrobium sp.]|uniref:hypothetical protein n=1 Tax=Longimicrobium sp. TaxID=2029185 RepID=UPI002ED89B5B